MAKEQYFWNKKGETFAGCKFGDEVTKFLEGQTERVAKLLELGKIVTSEPVDFDQAKENELNVLRKTVETQQSRITELEAKPKKGEASKKLKDAEAEINGLKIESDERNDLLSEAYGKIKELEADLDKATKPKGK